MFRSYLTVTFRNLARVGRPQTGGRETGGGSGRRL